MAFGKLYSVLSAQTTAESPASRPIAPEIPKSPPKWPLRPGVLVHVKCDTKQNLCANRAQSPLNTSMNTSNLNNVSYASPLLSGNSRNTSIASAKATTTSTPITLPELPARNTKASHINGMETTNKKSTKPVARALLIDEDGVTAKVESDDSSKEDGGSGGSGGEGGDNQININNSVITSNTTTGLLHNTTAPNIEPNNDELLRFTSSNLIERILGRLRWRREQSTAHTNNTHNGGNNVEGILAKSNKRAVSLLRATGWFGSGKSTNSTTGLMSDTTKNHLNGITCSDSGKYFTSLSHTHSLFVCLSIKSTSSHNKSTKYKQTATKKAHLKTISSLFHRQQETNSRNFKCTAQHIFYIINIR